jgi:hypothetical protein
MQSAILELVIMADTMPKRPLQCAGAFAEKFLPLSTKEVFDMIAESTKPPGPMKTVMSWPSHFSDADPCEAVIVAV